jgi:hypothetical protein
VRLHLSGQRHAQAAEPAVMTVAAVQASAAAVQAEVAVAQASAAVVQAEVAVAAQVSTVQLTQTVNKTVNKKPVTVYHQ